MQADRRQTPRLQVSAQDDWINDGLQYEVLDLSANGIGMRSNHPLKSGERITVSFGKGTSAVMEVISCEMISPPDEYTDGEFRLGCKFVPKSAGKSVMEMLAKNRR